MAKGFLTGYKTYDTTKGFGCASDWNKTFRNRMGKAEANALLEKQMESAYEILGIAESATKAEIKKAYRSLMMEWHPDKNPDRMEAAVQKSLLIIAAYEKLKD